ncbi:CapA family protein [Patescibacteria group bacterium]|nr:CapA family protein [Patescibacteria group bacterium]
MSAIKEIRKIFIIFLGLCLILSIGFLIIKNINKDISFLKNRDFNFFRADISSIFSNAIENIEQEYCALSLIFVGDMMFDRGVEYYSKQNNNIYYSLEKVSDFLKTADITFGNLEGPIVEYPKNFSSNSLKFAFSTSTLKVLTSAGFDVFSLANNHSLNMGNSGLEHTRSFLKDVGILPVGDTINCLEEFVIEKDNVVFFAVNKTFTFNCSDEQVIDNLKLIKEKFPDKFLIVSIHWGIEYNLSNSPAQQELSHKLIDNGADLIIGHHPHVVQNIEEYKGKLIFYSLGNFVFDQHFSEETQQGLAIKLCLGKKTKTFQLFPVQITLGQPNWMDIGEANIFLEELADRSEKGLNQSIKNGTIVR